MAGGDFIDQQYEIDSAIQFDEEGGDGSDSDDDAESVDLDEDDFFKFDFLTPTLQVRRSEERRWGEERSERHICSALPRFETTMISYLFF